MSDVIEHRSWAGDLRVLWRLLVHPIRGKTHADRLESFYRDQARDYDSFRARMLHGRRELIEWIDFPTGGAWVDMGAGTGENVLHAKEKSQALQHILLVDLSPSLLQVAADRFQKLGMSNVETRMADATRVDVPPASVDVVTFSYSLTMIPDWFEAIRRAEEMLKPGGLIAVTDFYVSRKYSEDHHHQHSWLRRTFWTHWFAMDNVFLTGDHPAFLHRRFQVIDFRERKGTLPYLPFLKAPYYLFFGRKPVEPNRKET